MLIRILQRLRLGLRGSRLGAALRALGIVGLGKRIYEKRVLRTGTHEAVLAGVLIRFVARSAREVSNVDGFASEEPLVERLLSAIQPNDICFDVGANIGIIALTLAARHVDNGVRVHAFEPEPRNASDLRNNVKLNGLTNVTCHELALGAETKRAALFVSNEVGAGSHSLVASGRRNTGEISVAVVRGDEFVRETGVAPDVLKVDVEGAEMEVLRGLAQQFESGRIRELFVELHPPFLIMAGTSEDELREWLTQRGYERIWRSQRGTEMHEHYQRMRAV